MPGIRRLAQFAPTLLGTLFLLHYLMALGIQLNGNPARAMFGDRAPTPEQLAAMADRLGTADPCFTRPGDPCLGVFGRRLLRLAAGDFGTDFRGRDVLAALADAAPVTLRLALLALVINAAVGLGTGVLAGLYPGRGPDYLVRGGAALAIAVPPFVLAALAQLGASAWPPGFLGDVVTVAFRPEHPWLSMVIPATVLGVTSAAVTTRITRDRLAESLHSDYVKTAVAKGLGRPRVVGIHALRNSLIPVVTNLGFEFGALMSGAVVVEGVFNIPGVGRLIFTAVTDGDAPVVIAVVTLVVMVYLVVDLAVDLLYPVLDPRTDHA
ncbi:ABC transporter permease [Actinocrispum wychmicini]|uniref:Peptide/nickel transport system permease protein/oligopeptide transport system permease protein n=1 Tax=Actinocrispum wychmicini TaxID=1213861 RepID=A0A4R2JR65_9PSEU|nr:ABC transporter permease [Actinocrispum wychmicini]TCO59706.1 peptide/nickel transport system permease protein/oligopeptide transport system permease protein [Actinocrispum wychmicini]